jgi:hypothetical protein
MRKLNKHLTYFAALTLVLSLFTTATVSAGPFTPAVEYSSSATGVDNRAFTLGYMFETSVTFDVNALAYWVDGKGHNHQVGIWDAKGNLLASTTVLSTDVVQGHFQYHTIADLLLAPGTYTIGGEYLGNRDPNPIDAKGVVTIPGYKYVKDEFNEGSGLNFPTNSTGGSYGDNGLLVVDFSIADVPEPATLTLLAVGIAGMAGYGWRRRKQAVE